MDTIRVITGGHTTAGGSKIKPGTNWLIISESKDNYHFTATICHNLSKPLTQEDIGCGYSKNVYGEDYIKVIGQVDNFRKSKFTGRKRIYLQDSLIAEGELVNGYATNLWKHYSYNSRHNKSKLELEVEYKEGIPNGTTTRYVLDYLPLTKESTTVTIDGKIISKKVNEDRFYDYSYTNDNHRITNFHRISENGDTISKYREIGLLNAVNNEFYAFYKHGDYVNLIDSSSHKCLCSGKYYKGAKKGVWKFYDKKGNVVSEEFYELIDTTESEFIIYQDDGSIKAVGALNQNGPIGKWKYYYDNTMENEVHYNSNSEIVSKTRHYNGGGKKVTPHKEGKPEGTEHKYFESGELREFTNYTNGIKHGLHIKFNENGNTSYLSEFINGIETTIFRSDGNANIVDGFKNGYNIQVSYKTNKKMYEGSLWMGYSIGKQIRYRDNGDYSITYGETNKETIMNSCDNYGTYKVEHYNKDGDLLRIENN
jgi:antitoxin component YwqK of YwqJK toxin-antitoxin module